MAEAVTLEKLRQRRIEKLRLGQAACEVVTLPSDPEIRVALVPLLEGEYDQCMQAAAALLVPENVAGAAVQDREEKRQVLLHTIRDPTDLAKHIFNTVDELNEVLEPADINELYDTFVAMSITNNPPVGMLTEEEIDFLKRNFETISWKELSGKQLYALNRFLSTLSVGQLMGKLPGYFSTNF